MKRLELGAAAAIVIALGALSVYSGYREAAGEKLRQKVLMQEIQAKEEKTLPAASWPRIDFHSQDQLPRYYEIRPDE